MTAPSNANTSGLRERILSNVEFDTNGGCWLWSGPVGEKGYGLATVKGRTYYAHRLSYAAWNGEIPDGFQVLHKCDVPACSNPDHLFSGTHRDNMDDKLAKGRCVSVDGSKTHRRMTQEQVSICQDRTVSLREAAAITGFSQRAVLSQRNKTKPVKPRLIVRQYEVSVIGFASCLWVAKNPGQALSRSWDAYRSYADISFGDFMKIAKATKVVTEGFGRAILVSGREAYEVGGDGHRVRFVYPNSDQVLLSHPADVTAALQQEG